MNDTSISTRPRRSVPLLVAAAILVVVVVGLVLAFGIVRPPALATLADQPEPAPPGRLAWTAWSDNGTCIHVLDTDGTIQRELWCERDGAEVVAWTDDGIVVRSWHERGEELTVVDPATGEVVDRRRVEHVDDAVPTESVYAERRDGRLVVVRDRDRAVVWEVEAPDTYHVRSSAVSPDGGWVAMVDSAERVLVVPSDGSAPPRVWAEDVPSWQWLIWEGTPLDPSSEAGGVPSP